MKNHPRELSAYTADGVIFMAEGLRCPDSECNRPIRCGDFEPLPTDDFQIICAGCGLTLTAYRKHAR